MDELRVGKGDIYPVNARMNHSHRLPDGREVWTFPGLPHPKLYGTVEGGVRMVGCGNSYSDVVQFTDDSRYIMVMEKREPFPPSFLCIVDSKENVSKVWNERPFIGATFTRDHVVICFSDALLFFDYDLNLVQKIDFPASFKVRNIAVGRPSYSRVFLCGMHQEGTWVFMVDTASELSLIRLFRVLPHPSNKFMVRFLNPSIICTRWAGVFHIFNLAKMRIENTSFSIENVSARTFEVSTDGKFLFHCNQDYRTGGYHIAITPVYLTADIIGAMSKRDVPHETVYEDTLNRLSVHDFRPELPLVTILAKIHTNDSQWHIGQMSADGKQLTLTNPNSPNFDLEFETPFPHPIFESVKPDFSWARIMSNDTLETNLTWPKGIPLTDRKRVKEAAGELVIPIAIWIDNIENDYSTTSFEEAKRKYLLKLVKAIAKEL